uniref:5-hydroxytryptamine receptor 1A-2 n=1 Tax=Cryptocotyle lingua TaxID=66766 RepID=A0A7U0TJ79_9TREM|nr:5-hydroxytryptamine receptor 1A-2 [Cryptocotyle lingua]
MFNVNDFARNYTTLENYTSLPCSALIQRAVEGLEVKPEEIVPCFDSPFTFVQEIIVTIVLLLLTLMTAFGNMLIGIAILIVRRLRNPANLLLFNLAVSDFLISVIVLPFAIVQQVRGYWPFDELLCDFYIVFDVLLCTASIFSLCAIAVDRYLAITRPLTYASSRTTKRMIVMITVCWFMAALISIPPFFGLQEKIFVQYDCDYSDDLTYQVYATFSAFYIPLIVMFVLYGRVYVIVRRVTVQDSAMQMRATQVDVGGRTSAPLAEEVIKNDGTESMILTSTLRIPYDGMLNRNSSAFEFVPKQASFSQIEATSFRCPENEEGHKLYSEATTKGISGNGLSDPTTRVRSSFSLRSSLPRLRFRNSPDSESTMKRPGRRKTVTASSENMKAVVTLGVIMGSFTLCWLPFFLCQLVTPIMKLFNLSLRDYIPANVTQTFLWLGYMNSLLNPIIYAKFNQDFRLPFVYILKCQCKGIDQQVRRRSFVTQFELNEFARPSVIDPRPARRPTRMRDSSSFTLRPQPDI